MKRKYYAERVFNMLMERDYEFENYDRDSKSINGAKVEIMDLYKDKTMYAVKMGNTCNAFFKCDREDSNLWPSGSESYDMAV